MKNLLREWSSFNDSNIILEYANDAKTGQRECYLVGTMIQADTRNLNERIYPLAEITQAVDELREQIKRGESILCECDHPDTLSINLDRVAGMLVDIWMDGTNGIGKIKLLPTTHGSNLRVMLESGVRLGGSSRGTGDVDHRGIVHDFQIVTVDIVAKPSAPDAYPQAVFESLYSRTGHVLKEDNDTNPVRNSSRPVTQSVTNEIADFFEKYISQK